MRTSVSAGRRWLIWLGLGVVLTALAIDVVHRHDAIGVDFHTYLAASRVGLGHGWSHLYDQDLVTVQQHFLLPSVRTQPFLSPPTVAWLTAALSWLPYDAAYLAWAAFAFVALAAALVWAGVSKGVARWIGVVGALAPWWVMHAINVGQVAPLVAAAVVVAWRLLRERRDVAAGLVLVLILLKPNTAILVPIALLFAGRFRALAAWVGAAAAVFLAAALTLGPHGLAAYAGQLAGNLPAGADNLTLHGAFGIAGSSGMLARILIAGAVMAAAYRYGRSSTLFIPAAIAGSLLVSPYLHASDLCLLGVAGFMVWEERPVVAWRAPLAAAWFLASPFVFVGAGVVPRLQGWPVLELAFLGALVITAWQPLTAWADLRRRAAA